MRMVPHAPLLAVAAFWVTPAATALVYFPSGPGHWLGWLALLGAAAVAAADAALSRARLDGLALEAPAVRRATKGRELELGLRFANRGAGGLPWLRAGLPEMEEFRARGAVIAELGALPAGTARTAEFALLPLRRGRHLVEACHAETRSRLGLWLVRRRFPLELELRVYPDLSADRRRLSGVFLHRGGTGSHAVRQVGKGREFEQLREYQRGDDYIDIDWKATARRGKPVTRTFQLERTQEVYVVLDHSRLSAREIRETVAAGEEEEASGPGAHGAGGETMVTTQLERFLHCALVLAAVAERQGDLFGFISFADQVDRYIRGGSGAGHYHAVRDALYTLEPEMVAPDFEQLMVTLRQRLTRRALLVMLTDLSDPLTAEQFLESVPLASRQHLVLVNMVRPERARPLFSPRHPPRSPGEIPEALAGHFQWSELGETGRKLSHLGVDLGLPDHEALTADVVTRYLNVKKRQLL